MLKNQWYMVGPYAFSTLHQHTHTFVRWNWPISFYLSFIIIIICRLSVGPICFFPLTFAQIYCHEMNEIWCIASILRAASELEQRQNICSCHAFFYKKKSRILSQICGNVNNDIYFYMYILCTLFILQRFRFILYSSLFPPGFHTDKSSEQIEKKTSARADK